MAKVVAFIEGLTVPTLIVGAWWLFERGEVSVEAALLATILAVLIHRPRGSGDRV